MSDSSTNQRAPQLRSAFAPDAACAVEEALHSLPDIVVLHLLTRAAGRRNWYIVRNESDFREVLSRGRPADSFLIFLRPELRLRGRVDQAFATAFEGLLAEVGGTHDEVILGEVEDGDPELRDVEGWVPRELDDARLWLREHWGRRAVAGIHPDMLSPNEDGILTTYIPDEHGRVYRGVY